MRIHVCIHTPSRLFVTHKRSSREVSAHKHTQTQIHTYTRTQTHPLLFSPCHLLMLQQRGERTQNTNTNKYKEITHTHTQAHTLSRSLSPTCAPAERWVHTKRRGVSYTCMRTSTAPAYTSKELTRPFCCVWGGGHRTLACAPAQQRCVHVQEIN